MPVGCRFLLSESLFFSDTFVGGFPSLHLFALHLRRTVLGLRLKRIEREFVIKDDIDSEVGGLGPG